MTYNWKFAVSFILYTQAISVGAQSTTKMSRSQVQFNCTYRVPDDGVGIQWMRILKDRIELSYNDILFNNNNIPPELRQRLNLTGNHGNGEYNLMISDVKKTDEGQWVCTVYGIAGKEQKHQLVVIVEPTSVEISRKQNNSLYGTEGLGFNIECLANDGDPAPDMTLTIGNEVLTANHQHKLDYTVVSINRSYDGVTVTCQAGYTGVTHSPKIDTAKIRLNLKPLPPKFNMNPVVTQDTKDLILICTSSGSRPGPVDRIWLIGDSDIEITYNSSTVSVSEQLDGTYTATSTLTYRVSKDFNKQQLKCGFRNVATGNNFIQSATELNVQYAPDVKVQNVTFPLNQAKREVHCVVDSNPTSIIPKWQHRSMYGDIIREMGSGFSLMFPERLEESRYQDTGVYVCTANNGIKDEHGNLNQTGFGYVFSQAPPRSLRGSYQEVFGQYGKEVTIAVSVYSEPKYTTLTWLKDGSVISQSHKYNMSVVPGVITDSFYGVNVKVDGFIIACEIIQLEENDFVNYTLRLSNGISSMLQVTILLKSASQPDTPAKLSLLGATASTLTVQWLPGFDGGFEQTFVVEYRAVGFTIWRNITIPMTPQGSKHESVTLSGLEDATCYNIRVYAENKVNMSTASESLLVTTTGLYKPESSPMTSVAIALSIVTFISLVINALLTYKIITGRRLVSQHTPDYKSQEKKSCTDIYSNIIDDQSRKDVTSKSNPETYEMLGDKGNKNEYEGLHETKIEASERKRETSLQTYEALGKQDKPDVYEELGKPKELNY